MNALAHLVRALGYFTVIPIPHDMRVAPTPDEVVWLPSIGMLVGAGCGAIARIIAIRSARVGAACAYAAPIAVTGALHLDGFLDVCDAVFAPVKPERRTQILRDPHHGSFAAAGQSIIAIGTYASLRAIAPRRWPLCLALSEGAGRAAAVFAAAFVATEQTGTAARAFERVPNRDSLVLQIAALLVLAYRFGDMRTVVATALAIASAPIVASALARRFDGKLTGDGYGFIVTTYALAMLAWCALDDASL